MASECTVLVDEFSLERWLGDGDQKNVETLKKFNKFCLDDFIRVSFLPISIIAPFSIHFSNNLFLN